MTNSYPSLPSLGQSRLRHCLTLLLLLLAFTAFAEDTKLTITLQDVEFREVMQMLSRQQRVNILVSDGVEGKISVNLYDVDLDQAIRSITDAAGYAVNKRNGSYLIVDRDETGKYSLGGMTDLKTFRLYFANADDVEPIISKHLSEYGKITKLSDRRLLVVEDLPPFLERIEKLLQVVDSEPKQILIEARILQVGLADSESFGLDWKRIFSDGELGTRRLSNPISPGLFFNFVNSNIEVALDALKIRGRLRTLSAPKLLALEHKEAFVIVGEEQGYSVTTTINQVTSESIEYLASGIILRVTSSVNDKGEILMEISPEVSTGSVSDDGIPSKTTTQVSTNMLVADGQTVFIGGLIKQQVDETREGVPVLGDLPGINLLFSNKAKKIANTETVILITPKIVGTGRDTYQSAEVAEVERVDQIIQKESKVMRSGLNRVMEQNRWLNGEAAAAAFEATASSSPVSAAPGPVQEPWFVDGN